MRHILLVGGAPRVMVDRVRFLSVAASGATAVALANAVRQAGCSAELLLSADAWQDAGAERYSDRAGLEAGLDLHQGGRATRVDPGAKIPSGGDELVIHLRPASKIIDQLRGWGLAGPIVGFKFEDQETVIASAEALRRRVGAELVVANSLCGSLQALVDRHGHTRYVDRQALLAELARRLQLLAA
jgi:phosphopantothenoylcysteine synthetase/decarboxylase